MLCSTSCTADLGTDNLISNHKGGDSRRLCRLAGRTRAISRDTLLHNNRTLHNNNTISLLSSTPINSSHIRSKGISSHPSMGINSPHHGRGTLPSPLRRKDTRLLHNTMRRRLNSLRRLLLSSMPHHRNSCASRTPSRCRPWRQYTPQSGSTTGSLPRPRPRSASRTTW